MERYRKIEKINKEFLVKTAIFTKIAKLLSTSQLKAGVFVFKHTLAHSDFNVFKWRSTMLCYLF